MRNQSVGPFSFRRLSAIGWAAGLTLAWLFAGAPLRADDVEAGIDVWTTSQGTKTRLVVEAGTTFGSGSNILTTDLDMLGAPLISKQGTPSLGGGDTVIERLDRAAFSSTGCAVPSANVRIRIDALSLAGTAPVHVTYNNGQNSEDWDVKVCLSNTPQPIGTLTIRHDCGVGGNWSSELTVLPKFIFTRRSDGVVKTFDPGSGQAIHFHGTGDWVHQPDGDFGVIHAQAGAQVDGNCDGFYDPPLPATSNFAVGVAAQHCDCAAGDGGGAGGIQSISVSEEETELQDCSHIVEPVTGDDREFDSHDRRAGAGPGPRWPHALGGILALAAMLVAAVLIPWPWRRP